MERSQSLPSRELGGSTWNGAGNPWYPERAQNECLLAANRPRDLALDFGMGDDGEPIEDGTSGLGLLPPMQFGVTGKGRGSSAVEMLNAGPSRPTVERKPKQSEGVMPGEPEGRTMGPVGTPKESGSSSNDLQRALEGELVEFLRRQNSKLQSKVATLREWGHHHGLLWTGLIQWRHLNTMDVKVGMVAEPPEQNQEKWQ